MLAASLPERALAARRIATFDFAACLPAMSRDCRTHGLREQEPDKQARTMWHLRSINLERVLTVLWLIALGAPLGARAATPVRVLDVDLAPLIEKAARDPARFAVEIPHAV